MPTAACYYYCALYALMMMGPARTRLPFCLIGIFSLSFPPVQSISLSRLNFAFRFTYTTIWINKQQSTHNRSQHKNFRNRGFQPSNPGMVYACVCVCVYVTNLCGTAMRVRVCVYVRFGWLCACVRRATYTTTGKSGIGYTRYNRLLYHFLNQNCWRPQLFFFAFSLDFPFSTYGLVRRSFGLPESLQSFTFVCF